MRKLSIFLACSFFPLFVFAQATWRRGAVVKTDGQRIDGFINDLEWTKNPEFIEFRESQDGAIARFTTDDLSEFSTDRPALYRTSKFEYDGDSQELNNLPISKEPENWIRKTGFLSVLVDGDVDLLFFRDESKRPHYFMEQNGEVTELLFRVYNSQNARNSANYYNKYQQQLILITNDCQQVQKRLTMLKYSEVALEKTFISINNCRGAIVKPLWSGESLKRGPDFGLSAHLFTSYTEFTFFTSKMGTPNYGVGLFFESYSPKRPNRISFFHQLIYKRVSQDGTYFYNMRTYTMQFQRIKALNSIRFSSPSGGGRNYLGIGPLYGMRFGTKFDMEANPVSKDLYESDFEVGVAVYFGKAFPISASKKLNVELRYELEDTFSGGTSFIGSHNIGLNVQFPLN
jgi:hypothetical protein